jgi:aminopeptidase N
MSSYLIVLVAGELERLVGSQDGVEIGIVTTEGKLGSAAYALASSKDLLHYYNDYFGVKFPLPKLDQIATPGGYGGAMENWGGIVYNEATLLYDAKKSPDSTKQRSFGITAHEMAHQWFGDLVTMAWWDNLWLNEGFASWMATKASDKFNPDWNVWLRANGARETAMNLDARRTSHPIQRAIANESQATDAFDAITYQKGQSFLRMLETYLGEDVFRNGIRAYMAKHQYSNTTTADLWAALGKASGKPVADIASNWVTQSGFPVVKVDSVCESGVRKITLTQEQFRIDGDAPGDRLWNIPVQISTLDAAAAMAAGNEKKLQPDYVLLNTRSTTINRPGCMATLLVDPLSVGYYRVQYAPAIFAALSGQMSRMSDTARLKLLSDTWAMVNGNRLTVASYLKLVAKLGDEPRLAVWDKMLDDLNSLDRLSAGDGTRAPLRKFTIELLQAKHKELGWEEHAGESVEARQLRSRILRTLGEFGDEAVIAEAKSRFQRLLADPASLTPSLSEVVLHIAGKYADQATYDALGKLAAKAISSEEKFRYFAAMNSAADAKLAEQSLKLSLSTTLPPLVTTRVLAEVAGNEHVAMVWDFAKLNGGALLGGINGFERNRYFAAIVRSSNDAAVADDFLAWTQANLPADAMAEAQRTAEAIRTRAELKTRMLPQLTAALKNG